MIVLDTGAGWSRGIVKGFTRAAHEHDWTFLHYHPSVDLDWLLDEWAPDMVVIGPELLSKSLMRRSTGDEGSRIANPHPG